jgi:nucleotide-binding universal stress UspA family protein
MTRLRRILHATDFSRASAPALARAIALARASRARLLLLHVLVPPSPFVAGELPSSYLELQAHARRAAQRRLRAVLARVRRAGVRAQAQLVEGMPAPDIIRHARRVRPDLIVIGTHGRTGFRRLFMGSVAQRVLQLAEVPVLTVRGR